VAVSIDRSRHQEIRKKLAEGGIKTIDHTAPYFVATVMEGECRHDLILEVEEGLSVEMAAAKIAEQLRLKIRLKKISSLLRSQGVVMLHPKRVGEIRVRRPVTRETCSTWSDHDFVDDPGQNPEEVASSILGRLYGVLVG